jgi:serine/threonine protein kinase
MTPERWKQTEELYHAASALPADQRASFLAAACPADSGVRREVESLLGESEMEAGLLDGPALVHPAQLAADEGAGTLAGKSLGAYQLITLLGAGGMGEVYLARDSKLERDVAIKILPPAFTSDASRMARFEREARALAALNHPNICSIHGFENADGVHFLVLEYVSGDTLARWLARHKGAPPLHECLAIARSGTR